MNFEVTVNGRPWRVAVEPTDQRGRWQVSVEGHRRVFDAAWVDAGTLSLIGVDDAAQIHEIGIQVRSSTAGELDVRLAGQTFHATVVGETQGRALFSEEAGRKKPPGPVSREGPHAVLALMPGRVVRVLVAPGDRVTARQGVIVVEAMKMENELRSPQDGVVREVNVKEGAAIEAGTVVVVIE